MQQLRSTPPVRFRRISWAVSALSFALLLGCGSSSKSAELGRANELLQEGKAAAGRGDHVRAIELYTLAVKTYPNLAEAFYAMGYSEIQIRLNHESQGDGRKCEERAIEDYTLALDRNPTFADAYFSRAMIYSSRAQYKLAAEDLLKAIEFKPQDNEPHYWLAQLYDTRFEDKKADANNHFEKYVELGGTDQEIRERVRMWKELKKQLPSPSSSKAPSVEDEKKAAELHETFKRLFSDSQKPSLLDSDRARLKEEALKTLEEVIAKYGNTQYAQRNYLKTILDSLKK